MWPLIEELEAMPDTPSLVRQWAMGKLFGYGDAEVLAFAVESVLSAREARIDG